MGQTIEAILSRKTAVFGLSVLSALIVFALAADFISPYSPNEVVASQRLLPPSITHPFGTDYVGRDVFSRVIFGSRVDLSIGAGAAAFALAVGVPLGAIAGYKRGRIEMIITAVFDVILSFPSILFAILLVTVIGASGSNVIYVVGIVQAAVFGRVVRGSTLSISQKEFIEAARVAGFGDLRIIVQDVLPNIVGPILVLTSITMAFSIILEAGLSYLGLGTQPPTPSWGSDLKTGVTYLQVGPWVAFFPGLFIMITVLALNMLGDGLRDALDPKLRI